MTLPRCLLDRLPYLPLLVVVTVVTVLAGVVTASPASAHTDPVGSWPLRPRPDVVADFDPPDSPYGPGHRGVDLAGSPGQAVHAALPGRISFAAGLAGRGVVVVDHGATRTTYEPVSASVAVGDPVAEGQVIGRLQLGRSHCFPRACLHWGWLRGDTYLDPLRLVGWREVRLLPLAGLPAGLGPLPVLVPWRLPSLAQARG